MKIYVGNLSRGVNEEQLQLQFKQYGHIDSVKINKDRHTGKSEGVAYIEMPNEPEAKTAIKNLNGKELEGQKIKVEEARQFIANHHQTGRPGSSGFIGKGNPQAAGGFQSGKKLGHRKTG